MTDTPPPPSASAAAEKYERHEHDLFSMSGEVGRPSWTMIRDAFLAGASWQRAQSAPPAPQENQGAVKAREALEDIAQMQELNRRVCELGVCIHPEHQKSPEQPPQEAPACECELRNRSWHPNKDTCLTCGGTIPPSSSASSFAERAQTLADAYAADRHQYGPAEARASLARDVVALAQQVAAESVNACIAKCGACGGTGEIVIGYPVNEHEECPACEPMRSLVSQSPEKEGRR
jgi:hypothetical protein